MFQTLRKELVPRVSAEIFVASLGVLCSFLESFLASVAHGGSLANSPQARANMGMCVLPVDEAFGGHLPTRGDF